MSKLAIRLAAARHRAAAFAVASSYRLPFQSQVRDGCCPVKSLTQDTDANTLETLQMTGIETSTGWQHSVLSDAACGFHVLSRCVVQASAAFVYDADTALWHVVLQAFDAAVSVFAPCPAAELQRALRPGGILVSAALFR